MCGPLQDRRVLVVDDEMLIALNTKRILAAAGATVVGPAPRLKDGIALAQGCELHAAVLDINLAGTYVWPLAEILVSRAVPFVFLSGYGSSADIHDAFRTVPQLDKPVAARALVDALAALCAAPHSAGTE